MATVGLRFALTVYGMIDIIFPHLFQQKLHTKQLVLSGYWANVLLRIRLTKSKGRFLLRRIKHGIINTIRPYRSPLLELPYEIREQIWQSVCTPGSDGRLRGVPTVLLINKQIYEEAKPFFDNIEHTICIGDAEKYKVGSVEFMGLPRIVQLDDKLEWHIASLKSLVLQVSVCGIGSMTPDCFDVLIAHKGKEQWRNLKRLVGIWPEIREVPLESVRLELQLSPCKSYWKTYRADFIRIIRNFKRTKVWAETGDCSIRKGNQSVLLPLVKAFNQGRRNWLKESDVENNLIVRYDKHMLSRNSPGTELSEDEAEKIEAERQKWSIIPTDDTSRSDNAIWPEWTGKEEKYIHDKMIPRVRESEDEYECRECLATFDKPGDLRQHIARGRQKSHESSEVSG